MKSNDGLKMCKRCNRHLAEGDICQSCKGELINHYEASLDWQIAFEIEKAQLAALRYSRDLKDDMDF
jgi:hypothetical protein